MISTHPMRTTGRDDAQLVQASLNGDRQAFGEIVERYQSLICSMAYNSTGSLRQSEDLAQDTFVTAWQQLGALREAVRLRAWLCGIARNLIRNSLRRNQRDAAGNAEPLETAGQAVSPDPAPVEQVITREEESILWRSLEQIPELYREPMILFYRAQQSIRRVADELDLSEDVVKQRLSRGRKMLHEQVAAFVEGALTRSTPGKAFTIGVLAALPAMAAKAAAPVAILGASAKGLGALKPVAAFGLTGAAAGAIWGWIGGLLGAALGTLGGLFGIYAPTKLALHFAKSDREREFIQQFAQRMYRLAFGFLALTIALSGLHPISRNWGPRFVVALSLGQGLLAVCFYFVVQVLAVRYTRGLRQIQRAQGDGVDPTAQLGLLLPQTRAGRWLAPRNYKSQRCLFGLPLVHVVIGGTSQSRTQRGVARGWIAIGDVAYGAVLAVGGVAVGTVAFGGVAGGFIALGGAAFGVAAVGGFALGVGAIGGGAVGAWAYGGGAIAWFAANGGLAIAHGGAFGGLAIAHDYAVGGLAIARHANDELARAFVDANKFFPVAKRVGEFVASYSQWLLALPISLLVIGWFTLRKLQKPIAKTRALLLLCAAWIGCGRDATSSSAAPSAQSVTLSNGVRVVSVYFPGSTNLAIFTCSPMSLTSDGPRQSQWTHLVEHLVIRSTVPSESLVANAETLPDHLRLDFYGSTNNWREGLEHHASWLRGVPFTQAHLDAEKSKVNAECDFTAKNLATHKFALAAWAQGYRHDQNHAGMKGDISKATLVEIQQYRDERLTVLSNVVVCAAGGVEPDVLLRAFAERLGPLKSGALLVAPAKLHPRNRDMTWDLDARHLVLTWPIPPVEKDDYAALLVAAQWLNMQFPGDEELKPLTGTVLAGSDLTTPEGNFFFVSASLRPGAAPKDVRDKIDRHLQRLSAETETRALASAMGRQISNQLRALIDPRSMRGQLPPNMPAAMLEMNLGLTWGMNEFRYGPHRTVLAQRLAEVDAGKVRQAARDHLADSQCTMVTLRPAER